MDNFSDFTRRASVPEHLEHYVRALSACTPLRVGRCLGWRAGAALILVCYPPDMAPPGDADRAAMNEAVALALRCEWLQRLTVLAPFRPDAAPKTARCHEDAWWTVDLPAPDPGGKLGNMLRRATACVDITVDDVWSDEHEALTARACTGMAAREGDRRLGEDSVLLFSRIGRLVEPGGSGICCYSARRQDDGALCGLAVGDHTSYSTSFYLFAFRAPDAPPGTSDALLHALLGRSAAMGQTVCNLGLGIHPGIHFFKRKWGARPAVPFVECAWDKPAPSLLSRLSGLFGRRS